MFREGRPRPRTELFVARGAHFARATRVGHATDTDLVTDLVLRDAFADFGDNAGDLVAGNQRVLLRAPLAPSAVNVGVADAGVLDLEVDFAGAGFAQVNGGFVENAGGVVARVGENVGHDASKECGVGSPTISVISLSALGAIRARRRR